MKYKNVFLIWLWADIILSISTLMGTKIYEYLQRNKFGSGNIDFKDLMLIIGVGVIFTLPSLVVMLVFHLIYFQNKKIITNYIKPYLLLIFCINFLYLLVSIIFWGVNRVLIEEFILIPLFLFTTLAGFTAFFIEHKKIQRIISLKEEEL